VKVVWENDGKWWEFNLGEGYIIDKIDFSAIFGKLNLDLSKNRQKISPSGIFCNKFW
jgi:hypothetical protein